MQQAANNGLLGSLQDFDHAPLGSALAVTADHPNLDAVFVQDRAHFIGSKVNIGFAVVAGNKAMTVPVTLYRAFNFVQQAAGLAVIFDTLFLFPEMPRWRNW